MKLMAATFSFLRRVLTNRVGHLLLVINLCFIAYLFSPKHVRPHRSDGSCYTVAEARRDSQNQFCAGSQPKWMVVVGFLNLPAFQPTAGISQLLTASSPTMCVQTESQISLLLFMFFASIQWLLVGSGIEKLITVLKN